MYFFKKKRLIMNGLRKYSFAGHGLELYIVDASKQIEAKQHAVNPDETSNDGEQLPMVVFYQDGQIVDTLFVPNTFEEILEASKPYRRMEEEQQEIGHAAASQIQEEEQKQDESVETERSQALKLTLYTEPSQDSMEEPLAIPPRQVQETHEQELPVDGGAELHTQEGESTVKSPVAVVDKSDDHSRDASNCKIEQQAYEEHAQVQPQPEPPVAEISAAAERASRIKMGMDNEKEPLPEKECTTQTEFENETLEIFDSERNNQLVLEVIKELEPFDWSQNDKQEKKREIKLIEENGDQFQGEVLEGQDIKDGRGVMIKANGSRYDGFWKDNKQHGRGRFINTDGDYYIGDWKEGKNHGYGIHQNYKATRYEGNWENDIMHGHGTETWPAVLDGRGQFITDNNASTKYEGEYVHGEKNGKGKLYWSDLSTFEGQFKDNQLNGMGFYKWADGREYRGMYENNIMQGLGAFTWQDGRRYTGQYTNDLKNGQGTFEWPDGRKYIGAWANGKQHGEGLYIDKKGNERRGTWENGKRINWLDSLNQSKTDRSSMVDRSSSSILILEPRSTSIGIETRFNYNKDQQPVTDVSIVAESPFITNMRSTAEEAQKSQGQESHRRQHSTQPFVAAPELEPHPMESTTTQNQPTINASNDMKLSLNQNTTQVHDEQKKIQNAQAEEQNKELSALLELYKKLLTQSDQQIETLQQECKTQTNDLLVTNTKLLEDNACLKAQLQSN